MNEKPPLYENRRLLLITILYLAIAFIGSIIIGIFDQKISNSFITLRKSSEILTNFAHFFDRSFFSGDGFGGQDPSYFIIILSFLAYCISFIPKIGKILIPFRKYFKYMIATILALTVINRGFKVLFARARPGIVAEEQSLYSSMWTFGKLSFIEALKKGSFTSGHTSVAVLLVSFGFISTCTKKRGIVIFTFCITLIYSILMALARVFEGDHYLSDGFWAILIGIPIIGWIYYRVFQIPAQEAGAHKIYTHAEELVWGILFVVFFASIIACIISIRYIFIEFHWYFLIIVPCSILLAILTQIGSVKLLI
ncbi:phosphatase PAP2 family protein [Candidatus Harpocratesius sp.]